MTCPFRSCPGLFIAFVLLAAAAPAVSAQQTSALINEQLDKLVKLDLKTTLPEAIAQITRDTGVRLDATPGTWDLLPYGRQTPITAKLENVTLREALNELTRALGLTFALRDEAIEIAPLPALQRLGRRATLDELATLRALGQAPLAAPVGARGIGFADLVAAVSDRLGKLAPPVDFENRAADAVPANQIVGLSRAASLLDALEAVASQTPATWYPWGKGVVLLRKQEFVAGQLSRPVSLRYTGEDVTQVLAELSQLSGVPFTYRPGSIQLIPAEFRRVRLVIDNAPVRQALESIAAFTGLGYSYDERGVYLWNQTYGIDAGQRDPAVVLVPLGNGMQLVLTRGQLPADVQQYVQQKQQSAVNALREKMKSEGFVPATQPASPDL